jgi:hypothetical protein
MSFQHDEKGYVIIGEAALSIALGQRVVSVHSLIDELDYMANAGGSDARLSDISEASRRLQALTTRRTDAKGRSPALAGRRRRR